MEVGIREYGFLLCFQDILSIKIVLFYRIDRETVLIG